MTDRPRELGRWVAVLAALMLAVTVSACGEDDEKEAAKAVVAAFEMTGSEKTAKLSGPTSVEAGVVRVDFNNASKDNAGVQLVHVTGGHTAAEAVAAAKAWGDKGKPLPPWVRLVGGLTAVKPGDSATAIQNLSPGTYAGVDIGTNEYVAFNVTGEGDGDLPGTSARIEAAEYSFNSSGLKGGNEQVLFTNKGKQPHFALAAPIKPGKTIADVRKSLKSESGEPPIIEDETVQTGILDGGRSQVVNLKLREGKYALVCFVADRKGGQPHAFLGMVSEATAE